MTNPPNPNSEPDPSDPNQSESDPLDQTPSEHRRWRRLLIWGGVGLGVGTLAVGTAATWFVRNRIAPIVGDVVGGIVQRPVRVGPVERVTPTSIRFGPSSIPPTATNPNTASTDAVLVRFSLLSFLKDPTVKLNITLVDPEVYLAEDEDGQWIRTELKLEGDPPVDVQFGTLRAENVDLNLQPYAPPEDSVEKIGLDVEQVTVQLSDESRKIRGNLNGEFDKGGTFSARANANIPEGDVEGKLQAQNINIPQLSGLIPPEVDILSGLANANIQLKLDQSKLAEVKGTARLDDIKLDVEELNSEIRPVNGKFRFAGTQLNIEQFTTGLGEIAVDVGGTVTANPEFDLLKTQFDVSAALESVKFSTLLETVKSITEEEINLPVPISGSVAADFNLTGNLQQPQVSVAIESTQPTQVDRLNLDNFSTNLNVTAELDKNLAFKSSPTVNIEQLNIQPNVGGSITGKGEVKLEGLEKLLAEATEIKNTPTPADQPQNKTPPPPPPPPPSVLFPNKSKPPIFNPRLKFNLNVNNVPTDEIAQDYGVSSRFILGNLSADAEVSGTLENLKGTADFSLPSASYPIFGQANIANNRLNTTVQVAEGTVTATAQQKQDNWIANINANQLALTPLVNLGLPLVDLPRDIKSNLADVNLNDGRLNLKANLGGSFKNLDIAAINGNSTLKILLGNRAINVNTKLNRGLLQSKFNTDQLPLTRLVEAGLPFANLSPNTSQQIQNLDIRNGTVQGEGIIEGNLANLDNFVKSITAKAEGEVNLGNTGGSIEAESQIIGGLFQATVETSGIALTPLVDLGLPFANLSPGANRQIKALDFRNGSVEGRGFLSGDLENFTEITGNLTGEVDLGNFGGTINAKTLLTRGQLKGNFNTTEIPLEPLVNLGLPFTSLPPELRSEIQAINLRNGILKATGAISGNLNDLDLAALNGRVDSLINLGEDGGFVKAEGQVLNGRWQSILNADKIALRRFSDLVESQTQDFIDPLQQRGLITQAEAMPLLRGLFDAKINASGSLVRLNPEAIRATTRLRLTELPIIKQPFEAIVGWNGDRLNIEKAESRQFGTDGFVGVEFSGTGMPEISNLNLNVRLSDFDLQSPLVKRVLATAVPPDILVGDNPIIAGEVDFLGKLTGSLSSLNLAGDLNLANFAVRDLVFDSRLQGTVNASLNQGVNLQLAGESDRIELVLNDQFLPETFLVKQGEILAQGFPNGENLVVQLEQFPLGTLDVAPLANLEVGQLEGVASATVEISDLATLDPFQIGATGAIQVENPRLGHLNLDLFQANVNLSDGVASLSDGTVQQGETEILIAGRADLPEILADLQAGVAFSGGTPLETPPDFEAQIKIPNGTLQDVLTTLEWFELDDIARGVKAPVYGTATDVQPEPVGLPPGATLKQQLRRLEEIQALLRRQLQKEADNPLPGLETVQGSFGGEISVQGSIDSGIVASVDLKNKDEWRWGDFSADQFALQANLNQDNVIRVLPLQLRSDQTLYDFRGQLDLDTEQTSGQFRIKNIRLETVQEELEKFVEVPNIDVSGQLNLRANLSGSLNNPQATGEFKVLDGILNEEPIKEALGSFSYNNARLYLGSRILVTETDPIQLRGTLPYRLPFAEVTPESNQLEVMVNVKDEGFKAINLINPEIDWVEGKGVAQLNLSGVLEQSSDGQIKNFQIRPQGLLKIQDAVLSARSVQQSIVGLSGTAEFVGDRIRVDGFQGELEGETGTGTIQIQGVLPVAQLLAPDDPDLDNPLRIALENLDLNITGLYDGQAEGNIRIGGTVLRPRIGGEVFVSDGTVLIPAGAAGGGEEGGGLPDLGPVKVSLDNFTLALGEEVQVQTPPVARDLFLEVPILNFAIEGTIVVNGQLSSLEDIRPEGVIELKRGSLNLYTSQFRLDNSYPQRVIFTPSQGLDPFLDLRLVNRVSETTRFQAPISALSADSSEIPTATSLGTVRTIRVTAIVKGSASNINDILELRSSPPRSQTQLIALLGGSAIEGVTGNSNLVLANIASAGIFSQIQESVIEATGLSEFRLYPARISPEGGSRESSALGLGIEIGLDVTDKVSVSVSRVIADDQPTQLGINYRVNDELLIRGATGFSSESEIRFEYEIQF